MQRPDAASDLKSPARESSLSAATIDARSASIKRLLVGGVLLSVAILYSSWQHDKVERPPGVLVPEEPYQTIATNPAGWEVGGFQITPLAHIRLRALVIRTERYWFDAGARLSPIDLALGWGPMSDRRVLDQLSFSQGRRWYRWWPRGKVLPISYREVARHSANMHMIPSSDEINVRLKSVRAGHVVILAGDLVSVETGQGWRWRSSLSRTDTGNGSCELIWVRELSIR